MKKHSFILLFLFAAIGSFAQTTYSTLYDDAYNKYQAADYQGAKAGFEAALKANPSSSDAWYMVGLSKYSLGQYESSLGDFTNSIRYKDGEYDAYHWRGMSQFWLKNYEEASNDFDKALSIKSDYGMSYIYRGAARYFLGKGEEALLDLNLAVSLSPKNSEAFFYRGLVHYQMAKDAEAVQDYTKSIELKPAYDTYYNRGLAKYMLKNYDGAISDFNMSTTLKKDYWQAWLEKGMAYYMLAKDDDAISNFNKAIELNPSSGKAFYYRGQSKNYKGDKAGSLADIKKSQQLGYTVSKTDNAETVGNYSTTKSAGFLSNSIPAVDWLNPVLDHMNISDDNMMLQACLKSSENITSAKLNINGADVNAMITSQPGNNDCKFIIKQNIQLKQGANTIKVTVTNSKGESTTESRVVHVNKSLAIKDGEKRIALIIGNSSYTNSGVLKNPVNDAELMAATLSKLGFDVIKRTNADKKSMEEAIREFSKKLPNYNVILFYYAGHGMQIDGVNYLLPVDVILQDKSDAKFEAVSVNYVVEELERYPNNTSIVILDACRNNPFRSFGRGGELGFKAIPPASGTIISFATSEGSTASDGSGNNGLYTEELIKQITVPQPIESVFKKTRIQVEEKSQNQQSPQEWSKLKGDFWFVK